MEEFDIKAAQQDAKKMTYEQLQAHEAHCGGQVYIDFKPLQCPACYEFYLRNLKDPRR